MSKIICDVCGTRYPESADQCPICGCVRVGGAKTVADDIVMDEAEPIARSTSSVRGGRFSKSNVRKRNRGAMEYEEEEEAPRPAPVAPVPAEPEEEAYDFNEKPKKQTANTILNVLLVIVILALLCVSAYIVTQYVLPGFLAEETLPATEPTAMQTDAPTEPEETEEPTIPCTGLEWTESGAEEVTLEAEGNSWLLNFTVTPDDTTDTITYYSSDESVVTVDDEGCLTAVGEGEAIVVISCGDVQLQCQVTCSFVEETLPEETEATEETTDATEATDATEETEEPTEATEATKPTEPLKDVKLEVNYTDITLTGHGQQFTFKVKGLTNEEVEWTSDNETVCTVENGTVTRVGKGTANITVKYGDQEVVIIVRCRNR